MLEQIPLIGGFLSAALPFLLVLGVVVFVHELGHYLAGRWCGIGADAFSIGFGPELFGWTDRRGTRWKISAIPLGGYVKFKGDMDPASVHADVTLSPEEAAQSFHTASLGARAIAVAAGPFANLLLSVLLFAGLAMALGAPDPNPVIGTVAEESGYGDALRAGDEVVAVDGAQIEGFPQLTEKLVAAEGRPVTILLRREGVLREVSATPRPPARVDALSPGGAAERAGVRPGDVFIAIDGAPIDGFAALQAAVRAAEGATLQAVLRRGAETVEVALTPALRPDGQGGERPMIGVIRHPLEVLPQMRSVDPLSALIIGAQRSWAVVAGTAEGLSRIVSGADSARDSLGGPIRIAQLSGQAADAGSGSLISLIAIISVSIGLINMLPVPVLDGGHLLFFAIEAALGRPAPARWRELASGVGLALVLALMLFATFNDIARL